ncbi:MAG TPA: hypothetical protein VFV34_16095 [Blastocatellia bacterium]|nr:hypothetical protein [Blastocatellia bacterium]
MPVNIKVIHAADLVRANPEGPASLELAEQLLSNIAAAGARLQDFEVLVDTRRITVRLTTPELWQLAEKLSHYGRKLGNKIAILTTPDALEHHHFFAVTAQNKGFAVRAFTSYENAVEWLLTEDDSYAH